METLVTTYMNDSCFFGTLLTAHIACTSRNSKHASFVSAEVLRFVSRVPRNEEFAYYYWAHCEATYVKRQRIVGIRFHGTYQTPEPEEVTAAVFERPEYIPPLLWMIYENPTALMLTPEKLAADLGRLAELVCDTEVFIRYLEQR